MCARDDTQEGFQRLDFDAHATALPRWVTARRVWIWFHRQSRALFEEDFGFDPEIHEAQGASYKYKLTTALYFLNLSFHAPNLEEFTLYAQKHAWKREDNRVWRRRDLITVPHVPAESISVLLLEAPTTLERLYVFGMEARGTEQENKALQEAIRICSSKSLRGIWCWGCRECARFQEWTEINTPILAEGSPDSQWARTLLLSTLPFEAMADNDNRQAALHLEDIGFLGPSMAPILTQFATSAKGYLVSLTLNIVLCPSIIKPLSILLSNNDVLQNLKLTLLPPKGSWEQSENPRIDEGNSSTINALLQQLAGSIQNSNLVIVQIISGRFMPSEWAVLWSDVPRYNYSCLLLECSPFNREHWNLSEYWCKVNVARFFILRPFDRECASGEVWVRMLIELAADDLDAEQCLTCLYLYLVEQPSDFLRHLLPSTNVITDDHGTNEERGEWEAYSRRRKLNELRDEVANCDYEICDETACTRDSFEALAVFKGFEEDFAVQLAVELDEDILGCPDFQDAIGRIQLFEERIDNNAKARLLQNERMHALHTMESGIT